MPARPSSPGSVTGARDPRGSAGSHAAADDGGGADLPVRGRITVQGVVERITVAPALAAPSFAALARIDYHGTRHDVQVVWMGQRRVPGIEAGVTLRFEGMVTRVKGGPTVFNPRYEIIGRPEES